MKTKPILFQGDMVRAILDGSKTQTRRIFNVQGQPITSPNETIEQLDDGTFNYLSVGGMSGPYPCPYGKPGDLIWVRETFGVFDQGFDGPGESDFIVYRADNYRPDPRRWRPSIHMPRWASRLTLEVTDIRVERVQDISEADAEAEGAPETTCLVDDQPTASAIAGFMNIWKSINGPRGYGWDANPWVWVIEFRAIHDNVDNVLRHREAT